MTDTELLANLEPQALWSHFDELRKIPRESKHEAAVIEYLISIAEKNDLTYKRDTTNNIVIHKPASKGRENAPKLRLPA